MIPEDFTRNPGWGRGTTRYTQLVKFIPLTLVLLTASAVAQNARDNSPQTIYLHGNILTGAHLIPSDASQTPARVEALAVTNSTIVAAGSEATVLALKGPRTQVIDLNGAFVMPGFNDAHTHMASAGQQKLTVDLDNTHSLAEMLDRIRAYVAVAPAGSWIVGAGWDHTKWPTHTLPTRQDIDAVTPGHPASFERTDGHILVANTAALQAANISTPTPNPPGGQIDKDPTTNIPTGILRDTATALLQKKIPPPTTDMRQRALDAAIADALSHGVTSVQDFSDWDDWLILESMEHTGRLHLRVSEWLPFDLPLPILKERRASHPADDPLLHLGMLKAFMDGSLGSRTAALADPYTDDQNNFGLPRYDQAKLNDMAAARAAAGFQLGFHAIGDEANTIALNAFSAAEQSAIPANSPTPPSDPDASIVTQATPNFRPADLRFRIEHAQVLLPSDFERFARLGVVASMQPSHLITDMNWAGARLGPERSKYAYAWRSMLDHHVTLAFGTDYPVESINPFRGLYVAITRKNESGAMTFHPEQAITLYEAIFAYTQGSAFAEFRDDRKGRLEPGFMADFILLDRDITKSSPQEILNTNVLRTIVAGRSVYPAP